MFALVYAWLWVRVCLYGGYVAFVCVSGNVCMVIVCVCAGVCEFVAVCACIVLVLCLLCLLPCLYGDCMMMVRVLACVYA